MAGRITVKAKVVLLGEGAVGKTSIVLRYVDNKFNDKHLQTLQVRCGDMVSKGDTLATLYWVILRAALGVQEETQSKWCLIASSEEVTCFKFHKITEGHYYDICTSPLSTTPLL